MATRATDAKPTETPFFFRRGAATLFGVCHEPVRPTAPVAFVLSHPFGEEKLWSHRVFVSLARALAARGHVALRFDYMGAGDSSGSTAETSRDSHLADLGAALEALMARRPDAERVGLIGLRFGASLATLLVERPEFADQHPAIRHAPLVLWDPILDGEAYFQELLRSNLSTQLAVYGKVVEDRDALQERIRAGGVVSVDGYGIGKELFESCARKDLVPLAPHEHRGPTLVVQIASADAAKPRTDLERLAQTYVRGECGRAIEQPFWREIRPFYGRAQRLQDLTVTWLETASEC